MNIDNIPITSIKSIKLYPQNDDEVRRNTNIIIKNSQTFKDNIPDVDGLHDSRMGTTDHSWICKTCQNKKNICPGHAGRIELNYPVPNPQLLNMVAKWLRILCHSCGSVLTKNIPNVGRQTIFKQLETMIWRGKKEPQKCHNCSQITYYTLYHPKENKIEFILDRATDDMMGNTVIYYHQIEKIFNMVTSETMARMKLHSDIHPKHIMIKTINAVPNTNRQDVKKPGSTRSSSDDLTIFLKYIVEINNNIKVIPNPIDEVFANTIYNLTFQVHGYIRGSQTVQIKNVSLKATGGRNMVGCISGFKGKMGLFRGHLLGKRTHHTSRAVITGDVNINITEVGIPEYVARTLYIEEMVTEYNRSQLQIYIMNGTKEYPGCSKIIKNNSKIEYSPDIMNNDIILEIGDVVNRDIINGDPVHINRSPSLKTTSILSFNAVVSRNPDSHVIRINPAVCNIFDADFDGDAMQLFLATSISARVESSLIMNVYRNIISNRDSVPNFGMFFDSTLCTYLMTRGGLDANKIKTLTLFDQILDHQQLYHMKIDLFSKDAKYNLRDLTSRLIPSGFNYERTLSSYNQSVAPYIKFRDDDIRLKIVNGKHISGIIDHRAMGQNKFNSIIHVVNNQFSGYRAIKMIYDFQKMSRNYIQIMGLSLGIKDYTLPQESLREMQDATDEMIYESERLTEQLDNGDIVSPPDKTIAQHFEDLQINACKTNLDIYYHIIMKYIDMNVNSTSLIINSGSKGGHKDHIHASGTIGQQIINGRRLPKNFDFERSSPYYQKWDLNPQSRGLITHGYLTGVSPFEFVGLSMSARHELTNTALNTAQGGEQGRLSGSILGGISVDCYRRSVKDTLVTQYLYGGVGWDVKYLENTKLPSVIMSDSDLRKTFFVENPTKLFPKINKDVLKKTLDAEYKQILDDRQQYRDVYMDMERCIDGFVLTDDLNLPVNVYRIVIDVENNFADKFKAPKHTLDPIRTISKVEELCSKLPYLLFNLGMIKNGIPLDEHVHNSTNIINMLIRINLCVKNLYHRGITDSTLDIIIDNIMRKFSKAPIQYGTSIGLLAAQSISSIMTQYIIDSKHRSGSGGSSSGVSRLKDIFRGTATAKMKTAPITTLRLHPQYVGNKYMAELIANHIEMIPLKRFVNEVQVFFEEFGNPVHPSYTSEKLLMTTFEKYSTSDRPMNLTKWCIRMELSKIAMNLKNVVLEDIIISIKNQYPFLYLVYTDENASAEFLTKIGVHNEDVVVLRCYIQSSIFEKSKSSALDTVIQFKNKLHKSIIRGVDGIISAKVSEMPMTIIAKDGSTAIEKKYKIKTVGTNVSKLMEVASIDRQSIITNSIQETNEIYGIEATREMILNELSTALSGMARAHFTLYADEMTSTGVITSIEKMGITKREPHNFLHQMAIKHPIQTIETAINYGLKSEIYGVNPSMMMGMTSRTLGTAYNKLILDREFVAKYTKDIQSSLDDL